jgi:hypothetical protein
MSISTQPPLSAPQVFHRTRFRHRVKKVEHKALFMLSSESPPG